MTETPSSNGEYNQFLTTKNEEEISFDKVFLPSNDKEENVSKIILKMQKDYSYLSMAIVFIFFIYIISISSMIVVPKTIYPFLIESTFIVMIVLIFILINCFSEKKVEISENELTKQLSIQTINSFNCKKRQINLGLENCHLEYISKTRIFSLYLLIDFKNYMDYDIDISKITTKPARLFYFIGEFQFEFLQDLNKNFEKTIQNKTLLHIDKYQLLKHSDNFYSFFVENPLIDDSCCYIFLIVFFLIIILILACVIIIFIITKESFTLILIFSIIFIINCIIILIIRESKVRKIIRIDFIFSEGKNKLFIGLVRFHEKSYSKTFIYDSNIVEKFAVRKLSDENDGYVLKCFSMNGVEEEIYTFHDITTQELTNLLSVLNQKKIVHK